MDWILDGVDLRPPWWLRLACWFGLVEECVEHTLPLRKVAPSLWVCPACLLIEAAQ